MNHLENDAKLKEEKVLCNGPFKLHSGEDDHLTVPSTKHKALEAVFHGEAVHKETSLGPKTPKPNQDNIDVPCDAKTSVAFTGIDCCNSPTYVSFFAAEVDASEDGSPRTPKAVFDPFAPGPVDLEHAPICKKVGKFPGKITPRRLRFDDLDEYLDPRNPEVDIETMSEDMILEYIYTTVLEVIIRKQTEVFLAKKPPSRKATAKTPPDRKLTGVADTCPAAPIKTATIKPSNIDM